MNSTPDRARLSALATISGHDTFAVIDSELITAKAADARNNSRKREIHVLHRGDDDVLQRMLNAVQPGTYIRPHRHAHPAKAESFVILQGMAAFVIFNDHGSFEDSHLVLLDKDRGSHAIDIREGVWHTLVALSPDTVLFEVKSGPYAAADDKDFAPWAPGPEGNEAAAYLAALEDKIRDFFLLPPRKWSA